MGTKLNILIGLAVLLYILSYPKAQAPQPAVTTTTTIPNITTTTIRQAEILNYSEIKDKIRWINRTRIINIENITERKIYSYETVNLSDKQVKALMNMKPNVCYTASCSDGYDKAKREALSILELKGPKFRETFGTGYDPFFKSNLTQATFRVFEDDFGSYINLNGSFWYLTVPVMYQYINETKLRNDTYRVDRENIKIRKID